MSRSAARRSLRSSQPLAKHSCGRCPSSVRPHPALASMWVPVLMPAHISVLPFYSQFVRRQRAVRAPGLLWHFGEKAGEPQRRGLSLSRMHRAPAAARRNIEPPSLSRPQTNIIVYLTAVMNESNSKASGEVGRGEGVRAGGRRGLCGEPGSDVRHAWPAWSMVMAWRTTVPAAMTKHASWCPQVNAWSGTCYVTPLIGAWLADTYTGRFWTIFSFSIVYMIVRFRGKILFGIGRGLGIDLQAGCGVGFQRRRHLAARSPPLPAPPRSSRSRTRIRPSASHVAGHGWPHHVCWH